MKKMSCYIVTKPVQYVNATNIYDENDKDCFITHTFSDAKGFSHLISTKSDRWQNVYFIESKIKAIMKILFHKSKYSNLYLDSDMGITLRFFLLLLYPIKIYVYEEGLLSYIPEIRERKCLKSSLIKILIDAFLGKNWSGGSFRTKGIYIYHPKAFKALIKTTNSIQLLPFKLPLIEHLKSLKEFDRYYSHDNFELLRGQNIFLYITSWEINQRYEELYLKYPNFIKVIKIHPHLNKNAIDNELFHFDFYPDSTIPAEILISTFIDIAESVVIIHEGSSVMLNFLNENKIIEHNIASDTYNRNYFLVVDEIKKEIL